MSGNRNYPGSRYRPNTRRTLYSMQYHEQRNFMYASEISESESSIESLPRAPVPNDAGGILHQTRSHLSSWLSAPLHFAGSVVPFTFPFGLPLRPRAAFFGAAPAAAVAAADANYGMAAAQTALLGNAVLANNGYRGGQPENLVEGEVAVGDNNFENTPNGQNVGGSAYNTAGSIDDPISVSSDDGMSVSSDDDMSVSSDDIEVISVSSDDDDMISVSPDDVISEDVIYVASGDVDNEVSNDIEVISVSSGDGDDEVSMSDSSYHDSDNPDDSDDSDDSDGSESTVDFQQNLAAENRVDGWASGMYHNRMLNRRQQQQSHGPSTRRSTRRLGNSSLQVGRSARVQGEQAESSSAVWRHKTKVSGSKTRRTSSQLTGRSKVAERAMKAGLEAALEATLEDALEDALETTLETALEAVRERQKRCGGRNYRITKKTSKKADEGSTLKLLADIINNNV